MFENQEFLVIIIHVVVGSVTEPWGGALRDDTSKEPAIGQRHFGSWAYIAIFPGGGLGSPMGVIVGRWSITVDV